jgi:hypothetical protein
MLRKFLSIIMILMLSLAYTSCREKTPEEKIKDGFEEVGDGIEDAIDGE